MRARLLLAFFGITAFAVLAAAAGVYAFREVGARLDMIGVRAPPALSALELSRSAERIIATAPSLLAADDRARRDEIGVELAAEVERLNATLVDLHRDRASTPSLPEIESIVATLTARLSSLENLVARRLAASQLVGDLRRRVFQTNDATQRLLGPWLQVTDSRIENVVGAGGAAAPGARPPSLASTIELQRTLLATRAQVSSVTDMLAEASTTVQPRRLEVLEFQLDLALAGLEEKAASLDSKLRPLFRDLLENLRQLAGGPASVTTARRRELALLDEGEALLSEARDLSGKLTAAVDRLSASAKLEIGDAIRDALSVQQSSTRVLFAVVALSLVSSVLIVWLYVGRNIVRRLTRLNDEMRAIAGGSVRTPVVLAGSDEIASMGRAVEVFRRNTVERDELLAERARAADTLEKQVERRTAELAESVEKLRTLGEVSRAVNSTVDLETVLTTIVTNATRLSGTEGGALYVYDDAGNELQLRATCDVDPSIAAAVRKHPPHLDQALWGQDTAPAAPIQVPDAQGAPSPVAADFIDRAGCRALLFVPLPGAGRIYGMLVIWRRQPGDFPRGAIELLQTFAAQSALAIRNANLFEAVEEKSRQLDIANKHKSNFLASASHDLRQPLHALNLLVAQLRSETDSKERDRLVARINAAVDSMNELFEALLDMSKLDAGVLEPNRSEFSIQPLLVRLETTFAEAARDKGLSLTVVPSNEWVNSDFILLERILFNLVSNAVRYTVHGGVLVGCRRRGSRLRIDVCDTGAGITEEQRQVIFSEFVQVGAENPSRRGGLGYGLSIVDRLGRLLDHPIEVRSRVGRGSRFSVSVPLTAARDGAADASSSHPMVVDPVHGKRIVVIDDDTLVLEGMSGLLRGWGCDVIAAQSGTGALQASTAPGCRPDLVISDYLLADGETGIDAVETIRCALGTSIPAFLISGDTTPGRQQDARQHGIHLLHKPVPPMRLRAMLTRLLTAGQTGPAG